MKSRSKSSLSPPQRLATLEAVLPQLRTIRTQLRSVNAPQSVKALQRAVNSVEGAIRHATRRVFVEQRSSDANAAVQA